MKYQQNWAIICGSYINACSISSSLRAASWSDPIVCLKEKRDAKVLAEVMQLGVQVWSLDMQEPVDLLVGLASRIPQEDHKVIFFTDERFHEVFRDQGERLLPNTSFMLGSTTQLETILDRFAFCTFIEKNQLAGVPRTLPSSEDPFEQLGESFFVRVNKTWQGLSKLPRVQLVRNKEQKDQVEAIYISLGLSPDQWCYQEALSLDPNHNVSVCGWHDTENSQYFATHHLLRHPNETGNGDVTELMEAPDGLFTATARVLNELVYEGPFELEFVLDQKSGEYKIIELNPRFWMQHGLIEANTNQSLARRYAGLNLSADPLPDREIRYWVNSFYAIFRLLTGNWRVMRYLSGDLTLMSPNWSLALRYGFSLAGQKLRQAILK